jgi:hypothetical protein
VPLLNLNLEKRFASKAFAISPRCIIGILSAKIACWNDPIVAMTNEEITLPRRPIIPVVNNLFFGTTERMLRALMRFKGRDCNQQTIACGASICRQFSQQGATCRDGPISLGNATDRERSFTSKFFFPEPLFAPNDTAGPCPCLGVAGDKAGEPQDSETPSPGIGLVGVLLIVCFSILGLVCCTVIAVRVLRERGEHRLWKVEVSEVRSHPGPAIGSLRSHRGPALCIPEVCWSSQVRGLHPPAVVGCGHNAVVSKVVFRRNVVACKQLLHPEEVTRLRDSGFEVHQQAIGLPLLAAASPMSAQLQRTGGIFAAPPTLDKLKSEVTAAAEETRFPQKQGRMSSSGPVTPLSSKELVVPTDNATQASSDATVPKPSAKSCTPTRDQNRGSGARRVECAFTCDTVSAILLLFDCTADSPSFTACSIWI